MTAAGRKRSPLWIKLAVALVVLAGVTVLFVRSLEDTRAEPYTVSRDLLRNWSVVIEPPASPSGVVIALRPPSGLVSGLFRQVFSRAGESLSTPAAPSMPLVLQAEFDRAFAGRVTPDVLAEAARHAGLESEPLQPRCLAYRRISDPGITRQLFFVLFDVPEFERFRQAVAALLTAGAGPTASFGPGALLPVLFIAASDAAFSHWLPLGADATEDCIAPIAVE
ncbi:MAG: hypothetical protein LC791_00340 [Acidobacteria bacterium]|nr:hypothetical protein [Acidobacteriota bacterium]